MKLRLTKIRATVTESHYGEVIAELRRRGALIVSLKKADGLCAIEADTPILEIASFEKWLIRTGYAGGRFVELLETMSDEGTPWLQQLKALGQEQGFLTYTQINLHLPAEMVDPEDVEMVVHKIEQWGFTLIRDEIDGTDKET